MNKLLVIGGTGFFGKSILDSFQRGLLVKYNISEITIIARNISKFEKNFPELLNANVHLISGDIAQLEELPYADIVIHAASSTNIQDYINDSSNEKLNIEKSTSNYCELAKKYHQKASVIYCSSGAVYGQQPSHIEKIEEDFPFGNVEDLIKEKRDYAYGKRFSEEKIRQLGNEGVSVSIARCFAFYGKYLPRNQHFAYGNFIGQAEKGEEIVVKATNPVYRSYMSADDLVESLLIIALNSNQSCPVYNVGSDEAILIHDLAKKIANEYRVSCKTNEILEHDKIDRYVPNCDKLKNLIERFKLNI